MATVSQSSKDSSKDETKEAAVEAASVDEGKAAPLDLDAYNDYSDEVEVTYEHVPDVVYARTKDASESEEA